MGDYSGAGFTGGLIGTAILAATYTTLRFTGTTCSNPTLQENFDITQYTGLWYEYSKLPNWFQSGQCTTATYGLQGNGVSVLNQEYFFDKKEMNSIEGEATCSKF